MLFMSRIARALWPIVLWMAVVFTLSMDFASEAHTSRIIEPLLRWLDPHISFAALERAHFLVRKMAHVTEYAILALLILRGLRILHARPAGVWSWSLAAWTLGASAAYASTDEIHQLFVPSRGPSVHDVMLDACGATLGLLLAFWWMRHDSARRPSVNN